MFVTPSRDVASARLLWMVTLLKLADEHLHPQFLSLHIDSSTARLLRLIVLNYVSTLLEIVEILRVDLQHDDNIEVHLLTKRLHLICECLAASSLL